jgi:hypothetical protein
MGYNEADVVRSARPWEKMSVHKIREFENFVFMEKNRCIGIFYKLSG